MTALHVRGACPRLAEPLQTGDGLLARIVTDGPIALEALADLCSAAQEHGNGVMEISARGSLQVRGLTPASAPLFASAVAALDIDLCDGVAVIADPLVDDPAALIDATDLASKLRRAVAERALQLAPKISVVVDGGGRLHLDALAADLRLRAIKTAEGTKLHVSLAGDAASATPLGVVSPDDVVDVAACILGLIAAHGPQARAADLLRDEGISVFREAVGHRLGAPPPLLARPSTEPLGWHPQKGGAFALGLGLAFGHCHADSLIALCRVAAAEGATWTRPAPSHTLLLGSFVDANAAAMRKAAERLGFIIDPRDPRRRIVACPGAPSCASGLIAARALAAELASHLPVAGDGIAVHVSGCAKGCAHPGAAPLTIVGTERGCGIVHNDSARATPFAHVDAATLVAEIARIEETRERAHA
jgi:precorrin-3B synthase